VPWTLEGIELMKRNRGQIDVHDLLSGPASSLRRWALTEPSTAKTCSRAGLLCWTMERMSARCRAASHRITGGHRQAVGDSIRHPARMGVEAMTYDGIVMAAVISELSRLITGAGLRRYASTTTPTSPSSCEESATRICCCSPPGADFQTAPYGRRRPPVPEQAPNSA